MIRRYALVGPKDSRSGYLYEYGPWVILAPSDLETWRWWREDENGDHLLGAGQETSLNAAVATIHAYEDKPDFGLHWYWADTLRKWVTIPDEGV